MTSARRDILISGADVVGSGRADIAVKDGTIVAVGPGAADALTDPRRIGADGQRRAGPREPRGFPGTGALGPSHKGAGPVPQWAKRGKAPRPA